LKLSFQEAFLFKTLTAKLKHQVHPFVVLAAGLTILVLATTLSGILHYQYELDHSSPLSSAAAKAQAASLANQSSAKITQSTAEQTATQSGQTASTAAAKPGSANANRSVAASAASNSTASSANSQSAVASSPATVQVSLSINGSQKGSLVLSSTSNQCDVLTQALNIGLLSSLDMRYSAQYGSYAVYVIDGIGESDSVWWTYTVNGKSPPVGCGKMPVQAGDSINWQYVKA
jgi:hypothetical protein